MRVRSRNRVSAGTGGGSRRSWGLARLTALCWLAGAAALGGCSAGGKSVFVLLPEEQGRAGAVTVSNSGGSQTLDRPWQSTEVGASTERPQEPKPTDPKEVERVFGEALGALPPPPARFTLYFDADSSRLTEASQQLLPEVIRALEERPGARVAVVGHTDTVGAPDRNYRLGLKRAETLAQLLIGLGAEPTSVEVESHGESAPLVPSQDEVSEPRNRRVEVTVR